MELLSTNGNKVGNRSSVFRHNVHGGIIQIVGTSTNRTGQRTGIALYSSLNKILLFVAQALANINIAIIQVVNSKSVNNQFTRGGDKFELFLAVISMSLSAIICIHRAAEPLIVLRNKQI